MTWYDTLEERYKGKGKPPRVAELAVKHLLEQEFTTVIDYESDKFNQVVVGIDFSAWNDDGKAIGVQVKDNLKNGYFIVEPDTIRSKPLVNRHYHVDSKNEYTISYRTEEMCGYLNRNMTKLYTFFANGEMCVSFKPEELPFKIYRHDLTGLTLED